MKIFKTLSLFLIFSFLAFAGGEWAVRKLCHSKYGQYTCFFDFPATNYALNIWVQNLDPHFGVWNKPHSLARRVTSCYDMIYQTNSYGARDQERIQNFSDTDFEKRNRVIFLGDSWVEGLGVSQSFTIPSLLENKTNIEHLNFGIGGFNSPLQYLLRYIYLAKKFDHEVVMVGILPFNDFDDMNLDIGHVLHGNKIRPYLVGTYPNKKIEYYNKDKKDEISSYSVGDWFDSWSYLYRMYENVMHKRRAQRNIEKNRSSEGTNALYDHYSRYDNFSEGEFLNLKWVLERFSEETKGKKLVFFTFPTLQDLTLHSEASAEHNRLSDSMGLVLREINNPNVLYIDLLPLMKKSNLNPETLFLMCDGHMSQRGTQLVADLIYQQLKGKIY